jgi:hypothetical protein
MQSVDDVADLLQTAWRAVQHSNVPDQVHGVAFQEAVAMLRAEPLAQTGRSGGKTHRKSRRRSLPTAASGRTVQIDSSDGAETRPARAIPEAEFFSSLSEESGVPEEELRQVFHLANGGTSVQVLPPTRNLGKSRAEQAQTVVVLMSGARFGGMGESPVQADEVRAECSRKNCYDQNNFASKHVGPLKGFNLLGTKQIAINPKWVSEFDASVARIVGRATEPDS